MFTPLRSSGLFIASITAVALAAFAAITSSAAAASAGSGFFEPEGRRRRFS